MKPRVTRKSPLARLFHRWERKEQRICDSRFLRIFCASISE